MGGMLHCCGVEGEGVRCSLSRTRNCVWNAGVVSKYSAIGWLVSNGLLCVTKAKYTSLERGTTVQMYIRLNVIKATSVNNAILYNIHIV